MKNKIIFTILICVIISIIITSYNMCYAASTFITDANIKEALDKYNSQADTSYTYEVSGNTISRIDTSGSRYDLTYDLTSSPVFTSTIEVNSQTRVRELHKINSEIMHLPFLGLYIAKVINGESIESAIEYSERQTVGVPYGATISMTLNGDELIMMDGPTFKDGQYNITDFVNYVYDGVKTSYTDPDGIYSYKFNVKESNNSTLNDKSYVISLSLTVNENFVNQSTNIPEATNSVKNISTPAVTNNFTSTDLSFTNVFLILIIVLVSIAIIVFIVVITYTKKKLYK